MQQAKDPVFVVPGAITQSFHLSPFRHQLEEIHEVRMGNYGTAWSLDGLAESLRDSYNGPKPYVAIGHSLGGNLAMRVASMDDSVSQVIAFNPVMQNQRYGADLLGHVWAEIAIESLSLLIPGGPSYRELLSLPGKGCQIITRGAWTAMMVNEALVHPFTNIIPKTPVSIVVSQHDEWLSFTNKEQEALMPYVDNLTVIPVKGSHDYLVQEPDSAAGIVEQILNPAQTYVHAA